MAELLLKYGAKVDEKDKDGNTPLFKAVFFSGGNTDMINLLVRKGADPNSENDYGVSPKNLADTIANFDVKSCFD